MRGAERVHSGFKILVVWGRSEPSPQPQSRPRKRTLWQLSDLICSNLAKALPRRLHGLVEALRKLVARLAKVDGANAALDLVPAFHVHRDDSALKRALRCD